MRDVADDTEKEKVQQKHEDVITKQSISENNDPKKSKKPTKETPDDKHPAKHNIEKFTQDRNEEEEEETKTRLLLRNLS